MKSHAAEEAKDLSIDRSKVQVFPDELDGCLCKNKPSLGEVQTTGNHFLSPPPAALLVYAGFSCYMQPSK